MMNKPYQRHLEKDGGPRGAQSMAGQLLPQFSPLARRKVRTDGPSLLLHVRKRREGVADGPMRETCGLPDPVPALQVSIILGAKYEVVLDLIYPTLHRLTLAWSFQTRGVRGSLSTHKRPGQRSPKAGSLRVASCSYS